MMNLVKGGQNRISFLVPKRLPSTSLHKLKFKKSYMNDGDKVMLVPGLTNVKMNGSSAHRNRVKETLKAMSEIVTIISLYTGGGNAKVRDKFNRVFFCNPADLKYEQDEILT
jgi:hypothetical protein